MAAYHVRAAGVEARLCGDVSVGGGEPGGAGGGGLELSGGGDHHINKTKYFRLCQSYKVSLERGVRTIAIIIAITITTIMIITINNDNNK